MLKSVSIVVTTGFPKKFAKKQWTLRISYGTQTVVRIDLGAACRVLRHPLQASCSANQANSVTRLINSTEL